MACVCVRVSSLIIHRVIDSDRISFFLLPKSVRQRQRHLSAADGTAYRELFVFPVAGGGCRDVKLLTNEWVDGDVNFAFLALEIWKFYCAVNAIYRRRMEPRTANFSIFASLEEDVAMSGS